MSVRTIIRCDWCKNELRGSSESELYRISVEAPLIRGDHDPWGDFHVCPECMRAAVSPSLSQLTSPRT